MQRVPMYCYIKQVFVTASGAPREIRWPGASNKSAVLCTGDV